jgi:hypothetical protein
LKTRHQRRGVLKEFSDKRPNILDKFAHHSEWAVTQPICRYGTFDSGNGAQWNQIVAKQTGILKRPKRHHLVGLSRQKRPHTRTPNKFGIPLILN